MNKLLFAFCSLVASLPLAADNELVPAHKVVSATVYRYGALLSRTASVTLKSGRNIIVFKDLPDNMELGSIRVENAKKLPCEILGVSWERSTSTVFRNDRLQELEKNRKDLVNAIQEQKDNLAVLDRGRSILDVCRKQLDAAVAEQGTFSLTPKDPANWTAAREQLAAHFAKNNADRLAAEAEINLLTGKLNTVRKELYLYSEPSTASRISIVITADAPKAANADITVSYLTNAASWMPRYQVRFLSGSDSVNMEYSGAVRQDTGEVWKDIDLTLSTVPVRISATPPDTRTLRLSGSKQIPGADARQITVVQTDDVVQQMNALSAPAEAPDQKNADGANGGAEENSGAGDKASAVYVIAGKQTVLTGDQESAFRIFAKDFKAVFQNEAAPSIRLNAYMKAKFLNNSNCVLLPGRVAISRDSGYIGTSNLKLTAPKAEISLYAGTIDGVSMRRNNIGDWSKTTGLISKADVTYSRFSTELLNTTGKTLKLRLREQMPVSEVEEVVVCPLSTSVDGTVMCTKDFVWEKEKGLLYWDLELKPNETRTINFVYSVTRER